MAESEETFTMREAAESIEEILGFCVDALTRCKKLEERMAAVENAQALEARLSALESGRR